MMAVQFRLRELMEKMSRETGKTVTYDTIYQSKGISPNTLSKMNKGKLRMIGIDTIDKLCDYLKCEPGDLIIRT